MALPGAAHVLTDMLRSAAREVPLAPALEVASPARSPLEQLVARETGSRVRQALTLARLVGRWQQDRLQQHPF